MRLLRLVTGLALGGAASATAQLAISQPTERLLMLPLAVRAPGDSAASVAIMDAARERVSALAKYKVLVIPKAKMCEALKASDFGCDVLLDDSQARLLARFLTVQAFTTGVLERTGGGLAAHVRVVDIGGSGLASAFTVTTGNPGPPAGLGEAIAQRLNTIIRAGEVARECNEQRQKGQLSKALEAARKALSIEPNLTAAHLCVGTVYEAQRLPSDSLIAASLRAVKGDSLNATAWENIARQYQVKGDTLKAIDAFAHELGGEPGNAQLRLGISELLRQQHQYQRAVTLLDEGLARSPGDQKMVDLKTRACIEGSLWRCALDGLSERAKADTSLLADTAFLKTVIGAAEQLSDTQALLRFTHSATKYFATSAVFWKKLGGAFDLAGRPDSAIWAYRKSLAIDPSDLNGGLLVAKAIVDGAAYDTAKARQLTAAKDTVALRALQSAYADRLDTARVYLDRAQTASDSSVRLNASVILLTGGSKLAQAGAYDRAYRWLDQTLQLVAPRTPADTVGPRQQIRVQASFWYGIASVASLGGPYSEMVKSKSCVNAKTINDRIARSKDALILGARVHPPTVSSMLQNLSRYEAIMPQVKKQFKCTNF